MAWNKLRKDAQNLEISYGSRNSEVAKALSGVSKAIRKKKPQSGEVDPALQKLIEAMSNHGIRDKKLSQLIFVAQKSLRGDIRDLQLQRQPEAVLEKILEQHVGLLVGRKEVERRLGQAPDQVVNCRNRKGLPGQLGLDPFLDFSFR